MMDRLGGIVRTGLRPNDALGLIGAIPLMLDAHAAAPDPGRKNR